jgi:hypothetical protein
LEFWQPSILVNRDIGFDLVRYGIDAFHRIKQNIIEKCLDGGINFVPAGKLLMRFPITAIRFMTVSTRCP